MTRQPEGLKFTSPGQRPGEKGQRTRIALKGQYKLEKRTMAQSLAKVLVHLVFSTKGRRRLIPEDLREELNAYLVGILRNHDSPALLVNCVEDHAHILFRLSRNYAIKTIVEEVKKASSKWVKTKGPEFRGFYWQNGYGAFSVSVSNVESVKSYIASQEEHHRTMSFQDKFRRFLQRHGIDYDERYVWD